jgi:hypothetical protein
VGHTHEDIDACFGTLASWFTTEAQVLTPQEYKTKVEAKFGDTSAGRLKAGVEDVFVVPDYEAFFKKDFDKDFGHTHKNEFTQLQWRFEAVDISDLFPCGAKVKYQKFSNEQVTIIEKKAKMLCTTPVGRLYGGISSLLLTIINSSLNSCCYLLCACSIILHIIRIGAHDDPIQVLPRLWNLQEQAYRGLLLAQAIA